MKTKKEDFKTCKCGGKTITLSTYPQCVNSTANEHIQICKKCEKYRRILTDVGAKWIIILDNNLNDWEKTCEKTNLCQHHGNTKRYCLDCLGILRAGQIGFELDQIRKEERERILAKIEKFIIGY